MQLIAQFGLFSGILVLLLICVYSVRRNRNRIFLGLSLFFVWYALLVIVLNVTELVLEYPHFHRTGLIAAYLAFPFLYIYSRNSFYPGKFWLKTDWIFLIPAVIYFVDFMPFFLLSTEEKIAILRENLTNNEKMFLAGEGWMGLRGFHFPFAYIWIAIVTYFQIRLILVNWNLKSGFYSPHNRRLFYFIVTITLLYLPFFVPGIFGILFKSYWFDSDFVGLSFGVGLSGVSIYLFISPDILYGFIPETKFKKAIVTELPKQKELNTGPTIDPLIEGKQAQQIQEIIVEESDNSQTSTDIEEIAAEIEIVTKHMKENKPFRQQGYTIQDLSNETGIPVYQLSPLINGEFKMNFANWVNKYRIEYLIEQVPENPQLTLEAVSRQAGFISRSTFINAFKKEKGVTPREYFKEIKLTA